MMKKILFYTLVLFGLSAVAFTQQKADDWKILGQTDDTVFGFNRTSVTVQGDDRQFEGARVHKLPGGELDKDNYVISHFRANCKAHTYIIDTEHGVLGGVPFKKDRDKLEIVQATEKTFAWGIIDEACGTGGLSAMD